MPLLTEDHPLVLGSASPRRREILASLRIPHVVSVPSIDEAVLPDEPPAAYLPRVVRAKLAAVHAALGAELAERAGAILVADTSVIVLGEREVILGKPADADDALRMLLMLVGTTHEVHTRFALSRPDGAPLHEETVRTKVTFRAITKERAEAYVATREWVDKAGGYAVQGLGGALVSRVDGSYSNVVGLPACELSVALERARLL